MKLRVTITHDRGDEPRIFDGIVDAPSEDIDAAVSEAMQSFNKTLHASLERQRQKHAQRETERAA